MYHQTLLLLTIFNPEKTIPSWKDGLSIISITFGPDPLNYPRTTQAEESVNLPSQTSLLIGLQGTRFGLRMPHGSTRQTPVSIGHPSLIGELGKNGVPGGE